MEAVDAGALEFLETAVRIGGQALHVPVDAAAAERPFGGELVGSAAAATREDSRAAAIAHATRRAEVGERLLEAFEPGGTISCSASRAGPRRADDHGRICGAGRGSGRQRERMTAAMRAMGELDAQDQEEVVRTRPSCDRSVVRG